MKNSTLNSIPSPIPSEIKNLFCVIDEDGALGKNPKTHPKWEDFIHALNAKYNDSITGIMIFSYKENDHTSFSFMLYPEGPINRGDGLMPDNYFIELIEVFKIQKGRTFEEFVSI